MATLASGTAFSFNVGGQSRQFTVGDSTQSGFKARSVNFEAADVYDVTLDGGNEKFVDVEYDATGNTLKLKGSCLYNGIRMDFADAYALGGGNNLLAQIQSATSKAEPTITVGVQSLFGETDSLLEDVSVSGAYAAAQNGQPAKYNWTGSIILDFTPEDKEHKDDISVSLSNLNFGTYGTNNKTFLKSATLSLNPGEGNAISLGGVSIAPTTLTISYTDNRDTVSGATTTFNKDFALTLGGKATWGAETTSKDDDFSLDLSGSGTYSQNFTTAKIENNVATTNASPIQPIKINGGLTAFEGTVTGDGSIDLGPLALKPKNATISYAANLEKKYSLWNVGGSLGMEVGFLPNVTVNLGINDPATNEASTALTAILKGGVPVAYPTAGAWSLGEINATLEKVIGGEVRPIVDLGLISVDKVGLSLNRTTSQQSDPDPTASLGFYKFVNNNIAQPIAAPTNATQDAGKSIKLTVEGVKINSSGLVNTLSDTAETITEVLSPVRPLVDFFTQEVTLFDGVDQALKDPIVSFLESTPNNAYIDNKIQAVEFVDSALAAKSLFNGQTPTSMTPAVKAAENVFTVLDQVNALADQSKDSGSINLGDFSFEYALNKLKPQPISAPTQAGAATATNQGNSSAVNNSQSLAPFKSGGSIANQIASVQNPTAPPAGQGQNPLFTSNSKIEFPVLSDPIGYVTKYFTEGSADLFNVDLDLGFAQNFDVSVPIPAFPVVKVGIQGGVDAKLKTKISSSLDAAALSRLAASDSPIATLGEEILYGTGIDLANTNAQFGANLGISVGVDAYIASLNLVGGLQGRLNIQPVLMENSTTKAASQVLKLGTPGGGSVAKPAFVQSDVKLNQLTLQIKQDLSNVLAAGSSDNQVAYAKNMWLLTIIIDSLSNPIDQQKYEAVRAKLGTYVPDRLRLIEIDKNVINAYSQDYKTISINLAELRNTGSAIYSATLSALKDQLEIDLDKNTYDSLGDEDFAKLMDLIANSTPTAIEYATIDKSDETSEIYTDRKDFLQKNLAFELTDGTTGAKASKQPITYYLAPGKSVKTSNFYQPKVEALNSSSASEFIVKINGKLTQPFNSVGIDLLATDVAAETNITIKAKDNQGQWNSIGVLSRTTATISSPATLSLSSALDDKAAELLLIAPKDDALNKSSYKLVLNLSNLNRANSTSFTQAIIDQASQGTLELAFDITKGSTKSLAFSEPRIVQGGAVSIGVESGATNSKLLVNAMGNLDDYGNTSNKLNEFALIGQPTDILNPAEWAYARNAFGGVPKTAVNVGTNVGTLYDSLAIVNGINRVAILDTLSKDVEVKAGTDVRQTVDPLTGNTFLSFIDKSGNLAVAVRAASGSVFELLKTFTGEESRRFSYTTSAPDIVAYNNKLMGAATASTAGKMARFLLTNIGDLKQPKYKLEIDSQADLVRNAQGPIRLGLIAEKDLISNGGNEWTVAYAYKTDLQSNQNATVQWNSNFKSSNYADASDEAKGIALNLDLAQSFNNWSGQSSQLFGSATLDVEFMEFGSQQDLLSRLKEANTSTLFILEPDGPNSENLTIWNTSSSNNRKYQYQFNIPNIRDASLSVAYHKQAAANEVVPAFINNWKGTDQTTATTTPWKSENKAKDFAFVISGKRIGDVPFSRNGSSDSLLVDNKEVAYLFSPYNDLLSANMATLTLTSHSTATSNGTANQNVDNAKGGLSWSWWPMLAKENDYKSSVELNAGTNSLSYLSYGLNEVVALDYGQAGTAVSNLRSLNPSTVSISPKSFQILPRSSGSYALSGFTSGGNIVSVDQIPNYETGLLTTEAAFHTPNWNELANSYFNGTASFVSQGEWAPLGIANTGSQVYYGDLRDPIALQPKQPGLLAEYFTNQNRSGLSAINRIETKIDFDWADKAPENFGKSDDWSARFTGYLSAPESGKYTFHLTKDDGARLKIGDQTVIDQLNRSVGDFSGEIQLTAGYHPIILDYTEVTGNAVVKLYWTRPGHQDKEIIPTANLFSLGSPPIIDVGASTFTTPLTDESLILAPGQQLTSKNGKYSLDMQKDGQLILFENTTNGRVVIWNFNDFQYQSDKAPLVGGYLGDNSVRQRPGTSFVIRKRPKLRSSNSTSDGYYLALKVPAVVDYSYIPLNPDEGDSYNINYRRIHRAADGSPILNDDGSFKWVEIDYSWRKNNWGSLADTDEGNDPFSMLVLDNEGNLTAFDPQFEKLFYLKSDWRGGSGQAITLSDATPVGFNGLVSDIIVGKLNTTTDLSTAKAYDSFGADSRFKDSGYTVVGISPDLNSKNGFVNPQDPSNPSKSGTAVRDIVLNSSNGGAALLSRAEGLFPDLSSAITWGRGAPPANSLKSIDFLTPISNRSKDSSLDVFLQGLWGSRNDMLSVERDLLEAAVPIENKTFEEWAKAFKSKYSSLRALSVLPAVSNKTYLSVPTVELTPRSAELDKVYQTYAADVNVDDKTINIETNFKLDAFVKVVASFAWWNAELLNLTFPIIDETWTFKTGYGAGGPVYGSQQIHFDQDLDLVADNGELASINNDAAFALDLSPLVDSLSLDPASPRNTLWDGSQYVYAPPAQGIDFRAGLLVVQSLSEDSAHDAATGLANNKIYLAKPDSEYLVANIWTSLKSSLLLHYRHFSVDATDVAKADFYQSSAIRYSNDPFFVTKLTPVALDALISRRLAAIPAAYATSAGDTFDAYNGMVVADQDVAAQAFEAFRFTSRLTFVLETVERLLNRLKLDKEHWGQADTFKDRSSLISSYQLISTLAMAVEGQLDAYYTDALNVAAAGQSATLAAIADKTFKLDLSNADHLHLLLRFACLTVPTLLGQSTALFNAQGRLDLDDPTLGSKLDAQALGLAQVARDLAALTTAYDVQAQRLFNSDPRLVTALLAPVKRSALEAGGVIDTMLEALPTANGTSNFGDVFERLLSAATRHRPELHDTTRIASITEALENDFDSQGNPVQHAAVRISLNHAAPPGGTVVPLTYSGSAVYGTDYQFEGNDQRPGYAFIPFGETSVVVPIVQPKASDRDWAVTIGIEDPSSSYAVSADINRVLVRYRASTGKISLYDNNVLVRLSDDPAEPHKLVSASPEDRTFDYDFYKDSRVVGIEAATENGLVATALQYFVSSLDSQISIYATKMPTTPPQGGGQWLLINDDVMSVYEGDAGPTDLVQFFNASTGRYGYAPAGEIDHAYQGSAWQNQGVVFSLRQFNREIAEAIGTITPVASVGTQFLTYPERTSLAADTLAKIEAYGLAEAQINRSVLRVRPQLAAHQQGRASVVMDLAAVADHLWQPGTGVAEKFAALFKVRSNGEVTGLADAKTGSGARLYSLHSSSGSLDTVVFDYADGVTDNDPVEDTLDVTAAVGLTASFAPTLQAKSGAFQFLDSSKSGMPVIGSLQITLRSGSDVVRDLRYAVLEASESLQSLAKTELVNRSRLLISSLESTDVTALPSQVGELGYRQTLSLVNGQQLVLLEQSGRDPASPIEVLSIPSTLTSGTIQSLTTPGGAVVDLQVSSEVPKLQEFLGRDQQVAPVLNFTGLDGQSVRFDVEVSREADFNSKLGFYRVVNVQGAVRDGVTGAILTPGDANYTKAALDPTNLANLREFSVADDRTDVFSSLTVSEPGLLAPYASVNGNTLFGFASANPDGRSHFKVLAQNVFAYEDTIGTSNGLADFDDMLIAIRNPVLVG
jgi:hypothetical protein